MGKIDRASLIITLGLVSITVYLWYNFMVLNTDYGENNLLFRVLAIIFMVLTLPMVLGCIVKYYGMSGQDLENMAPK